MLVFTVDLAMASYIGYGLKSVHPHALGIDYAITLLYAPLSYLYVVSIIKRKINFEIKDGLHFIPFMILVLYLVPFYLSSGEEKIALTNSSGSLTYGFGFISNAKLAYNLSYFPFIIREVLLYRKKLKEQYSSIEKHNLNWLQVFTLCLVSMVIFTVGIQIVGYYSNVDDKFWMFNLIAVTVFVYSIGYLGLIQPEFFTDFEKHLEAKEETGVEKEESYTKSGLDDGLGREISERLLRLMDEEKPFTNNELSLRNLADMLEVSSHNLTEVINKFSNKNFYDFVNAYRVEEVKSRIKNPENNNYTLLAIGLESGFNSKSSFNSVFKKHTGQTPSQYKKELQTEKL
tara:strand:- start:284 stop:1315 length:1032 start_codon:yes stop_codon:yes gene_type:complete